MSSLVKHGHRWKGGLFIDTMGYRCIRKPDHPRARQNGYVFEHILVMEQKLGRHLKSKEVVHHINHDRLDNRPENLELFNSHSEHMRHHCEERFHDIRNETISCVCGCGTTIKVRDGHGRKRRFMNGHNNNISSNLYTKDGDIKHSRWNIKKVPKSKNVR